MVRLDGPHYDLFLVTTRWMAMARARGLRLLLVLEW